MKKTIIIFSFAIAALLTGFNGGEVIAQEISFTLHKGWNLVSVPIASKAINSNEGEGYHVFFFDPSQKTYFGGTFEDTRSDEFNADLKKVLNLYGENSDDDLYVLTTAAWLYSSNDQKISVSGFDDLSMYDDFMETEYAPFRLFRGYYSKIHIHNFPNQQYKCNSLQNHN